ncbi:MAG: histidine phosphatase family protein [Clostridia bacterium]|nr:histidine phosphatase family protein [Clostridia bacterium]
MKLIIIRHGDPDYEHDSLTEAGFIEAELLSEKIKKMDVTAFYCSPLGRAQETSKPTLRKMGREAETLDWLREFPPQIKGKEGAEELSCCWDWLPTAWTVIPEFFDKDKWMNVPVYKEAGVPEAYKYVCDGLDTLLEKHGYVRDGLVYRAERPNEDTVVLFCHFGLECVLLSHVLNISPVPLWHGSCAAPTSVTTLVTEERREGVAYFRMGSFGDTSHLYVKDVEPAFAARFCETYYRKDQRHD